MFCFFWSQTFPLSLISTKELTILINSSCNLVTGSNANEVFHCLIDHNNLPTFVGYLWYIPSFFSSNPSYMLWSMRYGHEILFFLRVPWTCITWSTNLLKFKSNIQIKIMFCLQEFYYFLNYNYLTNIFNISIIELSNMAPRIHLQFDI